MTKAECSRRDIAAHCTTHLADFKRPRVIEFRRELPKSPLGKVLRKYLIDEEQRTRSRLEFDPVSGFRPVETDPSDAGEPDRFAPLRGSASCCASADSRPIAS